MSMQDYQNKLKAARADYPFKRWGESGLDQYTPEAARPSPGSSTS